MNLSDDYPALLIHNYYYYNNITNITCIGILVEIWVINTNLACDDDLSCPWHGAQIDASASSLAH